MSPFRQYWIDLRWPSLGSPQRTYHPVKVDDSQSDAESSSPFLEKPAPLLVQTPGARRRFALLGIALGALFGVVVTLLFLHFSGVSVVTDDAIYHSPVPKLPYIIRHFTHDSIFGEVPSPKSDAAWATLEGPTWFSNPSPYNQIGHIRVDGSLRYEGIEPGMILPDGTQKYSVSFAHQLHCLGAIRRTTFQLLHGSINITEFLAADGDRNAPDWVPSSGGVWHLTHCFDYVRQALQCAGDTSLEWAIEFSGKPIAIGWDVPHKCVDWNALQTYMEDNG